MSDSEATPGLDVDALVERNPKVDRDQFHEASKLIEELEREGIGRPAYSLRSPYERHSLARRPEGGRIP
ncbi:MAG: hypothetical protein H0W52_08180 [Rubrobacteraceae bacterium]|nr:hypothetical protein [Rubrobacteraceae bacterium]